MAPVIDVCHLSRSFGQLIAVNDVSFQVQRAAIFGLLGPNGSGKSTIIRMLLGILQPTSGEARVLGYDATRDSELIKPRVGYMSQQFSLYGDLTVRENLEFYGRVYGLSPDRLEQRKAEVLDLTSLHGRLDQLAQTLSGGWKQRLALACALIHEPSLLFLDEPTAGIDPVARRQLWDLLFELSASGVTMLVTTHYMDEAERCTDVGYIYSSRLLVQGKPERLKQLPEVTPPGTRRLEVRVPYPSSRLAMLRRLDGVVDATLFGETIHVLLRDTVPAQVLLRELDIDAAVADLREVPPSLEDVFVTLTSAAERSARHGESPPTLTAAALAPADVLEPSDVLAPSDDDGTQPEASPESGAVTAGREAAPRGRRRWYRAGLWAMLTKEFVHIRRQRSTLVFVLLVPLMQTIIFGFALDTEIENIPMVVLDQDGRHLSRELIDSFVNTRRFALTRRVYDEESFRREMASGRAKVGLRVPPGFTDQIVQGEQVTLQLLIDGSDSQVATTALNAAQLLGVNRSMQLARAKIEASRMSPAADSAGRPAMPVEVRPRLLYNPDLDSSHFFVPGLVGIILQLVTLFLTSFAVVREREMGTLEQLFVTPVGRVGLVLGKLIPYAILGFAETLLVLTVMVYVFGVPIHGSIPLLLGLTLLFICCSLGLGLLVSTVARTQLEAVQFAFIIMLPSVLLSGFMFPRSQMPLPIYLVSFAIPVTYFIEILRGIVLRSADGWDLMQPAIGLAICACLTVGLSIMRFRKQLA
ncbi:MAG: ATP-binding cassette domain-containing protein [Pirellulales bacterium]